LEAKHTVFKKEVEDTMLKIGEMHADFHCWFEIHTDTLKKWVKWQKDYEGAYNIMVLKVDNIKEIVDLKKSNEEKDGHITFLMGKVTEL